MSYTLEQLNFLYLYRYCLENKYSVDEFSDMDIENIDKLDTQIIFKYVLFKEKISLQLEYLDFGDVLEEYFNLSDTEIMNDLGVSNSDKISTIKQFKKSIESMLSLSDDRLFIESFKKIIKERDTITNLISDIKLVKKTYKNEVVDNNDIIDLLFM